MRKNYFILFEDKILLIKEDEHYRLPDESSINNLFEQLDTSFPLMQWQEAEYYCSVLTSQQQIETGEFFSLRDAQPHLGEDLFQLAGKARQLHEWRQDHQFCGRCGHSTDYFDKERAKKCPQCGLINYPRIAPCILVGVTRHHNNEILLARSPHFRPGIFSILAGFVEPGESAEACAQREVFEEVGLKIKNLKFVASQPWPFPNLLMLGFLAEYDSGEIKIDEEEISEAKWFRRDELPPLPPSFSLSYQLIQKFLNS